MKIMETSDFESVKKKTQLSNDEVTLVWCIEPKQFTVKIRRTHHLESVMKKKPVMVTSKRNHDRFSSRKSWPKLDVTMTDFFIVEPLLRILHSFIFRSFTSRRSSMVSKYYFEISNMTREIVRESGSVMVTFCVSAYDSSLFFAFISVKIYFKDLKSKLWLHMDAINIGDN